MKILMIVYRPRIMGVEGAYLSHTFSRIGQWRGPAGSAFGKGCTRPNPDSAVRNAIERVLKAPPEAGQLWAGSTANWYVPDSTSRTARPSSRRSSLTPSAPSSARPPSVIALEGALRSAGRKTVAVVFAGTV